MPFIGNQPSLSYTSFAKQDFTTSATTSYTLDNPVANENEIALFINFVRQEPTTAYTASGTTLTLTSATSASDDMYCVYLGKAVQTVTPASGSVTNSMLVDNTITSAKLSYPLTTFSSTGIDDNATSTAITIDSSENVGIGITSPTVPSATGGSTGLHLHNSATDGASVIHLTNGDTGTGSTDGAVLEVWENENLYLWNYENTNTIFSTNNTERMRINSNGALNVLANGTTKETWTPAADSHQIINNDTGDVVLTVKADTSSFAHDVQRLLCDRGGNSAYDFLVCTSGNLTDDEFILRGDGNAFADGSWSGGGADYAEYFEWSDGNTSNEDRRGYTVVLDENKIRKSTNEDNPNNIIGVISGNPSVVGDNDIGKWKNKYQKDDYGSYIRDENGDRILNTEYDETQNYISREDRPEWDIVGLMGKVRINKGQTVGDRWIKMRDISDTVEEWLIK